MNKAALAALLSACMAASAVATEQTERVERLEVPAAEEATLADCRAWLEHLGELVDEADPPVAQEVLAQAEEQRDEAAQACDDGNYHDGILTAAEAIDRIEAEADN